LLNIIWIFFVKDLFRIVEFRTHFHLHDNNGSKDEHLPLGNGKIDFYPLIGFLKKRKELPLITLEPHEEADLWPSMEYLSRMLDVLGME